MIISACALFVTYAAHALPPGPTEPDGIKNGHAYVDLGLPSGTLWAVSNMGADSEYECGDYFAWGETEPRNFFPWEDYKWFVRYIDNAGYNEPYIEIADIGECISGTEYDAATVNWGKGWQLPDREQILEIRFRTFGKRVVENGVEGVRVYSKVKEGKSIFFGDFGCGEDLIDIPEYGGHYWTGSEMNSIVSGMHPSDRAQHFMTQLHCDDVEWKNPAFKNVGCCIRPVYCRKSYSGIDTASEVPDFTVTGNSVRADMDLENGVLELADISGRPVYSVEFDGECQIPPLTAGIYIATVKVGGTPVRSKTILIR